MDSAKELNQCPHACDAVHVVAHVVGDALGVAVVVVVKAVVTPAGPVRAHVAVVVAVKAVVVPAGRVRAHAGRLGVDVASHAVEEGDRGAGLEDELILLPLERPAALQP